MTATRPHRILLRNVKASEKSQLHDIRYKAWKMAYHHIYKQDEINNYFQGNVTERRTWSSIPIQNEINLICEFEDNNAVAYASFGWTPNDKGELKSLYVLPQYWKKGIGSHLWDQIINLCRKEQVTTIYIWVLENARSADFYRSKGCVKVDQGDYYIGEHLETASCYRWSCTD